ncbi:MAG: flagellar basal body P-ring formation chaperone FlgA [Pseudomonadota bacterium]
MKTSVTMVVAAAFIMLAAYSLCAAGMDAPLTVVVKSKASVRGEKIYLRDIAQINGEKNITQQVGSVCLGSASRPGNMRSLKGKRIEAILSSKRFWPVGATITVPKAVEVARRSQLVSETRYKEALHRYVRARVEDDVDLSISDFKVIGNRPVPEGSVTLKISDTTDRKMVGYLSMAAVVHVDNKIERRVTLTGWVNVYKNVLSSVRMLKKSQVITENDLQLVRRDISKLPPNVVFSAKEVMGKRLKHSVRAGDYLREDMVEDIPVVQKGDHVIIMAESSILRVTVIGKTLEEGCPGEMIKVKNSMSKKIISARVIDASTVKVQF